MLDIDKEKFILVCCKMSNRSLLVKLMWYTFGIGIRMVYGDLQEITKMKMLYNIILNIRVIHNNLLFIVRNVLAKGRIEYNF